MGWFLDGRVTAVIGTHTHVQTADERILPRRHGVSHRRRHDRAARRRHRHGARRRPRALRDGTAGAFRSGHRRSDGCMPSSSRRPATGRASGIERLSLDALRSTRLSRHHPSRTRQSVSTLFDLPFEEPEPEPQAGHGRDLEPATTPEPGDDRDPAPVAKPSAARLRRTDPHRRGAHRQPSRDARDDVPRSLGRRRALQRARLADRAPVLHAERRRRADQGDHVPLGAALPEVQARRRPARRRARPNQRLRSEGRISDRRRAHGAARVSARCSSRSSS